MTRAAFENAMTVVMALGGSTNAVLHLLAMARASGVELHLDDFQARPPRFGLGFQGLMRRPLKAWFLSWPWRACSGKVRLQGLLAHRPQASSCGLSADAASVQAQVVVPQYAMPAESLAWIGKV